MYSKRHARILKYERIFSNEKLHDYVPKYAIFSYMQHEYSDMPMSSWMDMISR